MTKPCLAITLVNPREPQYAASYLWCRLDEHETDQLHNCYCDLQWSTDDLVTPTPNMITWRTGNSVDVMRVNGKLLG